LVKSYLEQHIPNRIKAFYFILYEGSVDTYDIELISTDEFDRDDQDWACTDNFTSDEDICYIKKQKNLRIGNKVYITMLVERYLS
jgi:hypothetical protein